MLYKKTKMNNKNLKRETGSKINPVRCPKCKNASYYRFKTKDLRCNKCDYVFDVLSGKIRESLQEDLQYYIKRSSSLERSNLNKNAEINFLRKRLRKIGISIEKTLK